MAAITELHSEPLDEHTVIILIAVPSEKVVIFQAFFELYESLGIVRTLDLSRSLLSILTPSSMLEETCAMLDGIRETTLWRAVPVTEDFDRESFLGYQKKLKNRGPGTPLK